MSEYGHGADPINDAGGMDGCSCLGCCIVLIFFVVPILYYIGRWVFSLF